MIYSKSSIEVGPVFSCDLASSRNEGHCAKGQRSIDGKAINGVQYRSHQCFWLGKSSPCGKRSRRRRRKLMPVQPKSIMEMENRCTDPEINICGLSKSDPVKLVRLNRIVKAWPHNSCHTACKHSGKLKLNAREKTLGAKVGVLRDSHNLFFNTVWDF
jgi:hypothetical protein